VIFGSPELRARFEVLPARMRGAPNSLGVRATIAAWTSCGDWLDAVLRQLDANRRAVAAFVRERLPGVTHRTPEGTYLAWLDFSKLGIDGPVSTRLLERGQVACNNGADFGGYAACARLNFATTPAILADACDRVARALDR
jgi:cystathionine beta-lyase